MPLGTTLKGGEENAARSIGREKINLSQNGANGLLFALFAVSDSLLMATKNDPGTPLTQDIIGRSGIVLECAETVGHKKAYRNVGKYVG